MIVKFEQVNTNQPEKRREMAYQLIFNHLTKEIRLKESGEVKEPNEQNQKS